MLTQKKAGNLLPQEFYYTEDPIRVEMKNSQPWFVAKDVCKVLGIKKPSNVIRYLEEDEKGVSKVSTLRGNQTLSVINESGLYNLIFRSNRPEAKTFRKWVTNEVLPQLRKTGSYQIAAIDQPKIKEVRINDRVLYPYRKFCFAVGYKSVNYSRIKTYPNHFVKLMGLQHITKELAVLILQNRQNAAQREDLKEMQPVLPANFGQMVIGGLS
jgi:prophage antirepressor-like protein